MPDVRTRHRDLLERAATGSREHRTPCPEAPSGPVCGEDAAPFGEAAFRERTGRPYYSPVAP